uniref:E3 ubiquitin-protein ligase TRIM39-like n=1 Tax=Scatophagus argus TaxID=75038 RepID=UPI001ED7DEA5|nr:E3 ubiquitin-protein ligase TRIM39-like [Scatophagus argus]
MTTPDMSLQVCDFCDWSKVTTYRGLRIHQGKKGCTKKGVRIPESEEPPIEVEDPQPSINPGFETPQGSQQTNEQQQQQQASRVCRQLDFLSGAEQVEQLQWEVPTTTAQEIAARPKEEDREKDREAEQLRKAKQDRIRAELQQKIQMRQQKMVQIRSSVEVCKGSLDAECLEINNVFSEVMKVVEDARQEALQPVEERRNRLKKESRVLVQKLQKEIDNLKETISDLDRNPDLQVCPPDEYRDWTDARVDTSFSFGTLRSETSYMMEEIHQKLEKLSSVELQRISSFAVDVKLDPTSAHQCLVLSPDGKEVKDGGQSQEVPDLPGRFDMFGSVLGLNSLTSGKFYWEVEVGNKTGWDLGVARRGANRKGKLKLSPDNGYWVAVHYEEEKYAAMTAPPASLSLPGKPQKVGVFVDYEEGLVSFYDVTAQSHIYSFTGCSFSDDIFPYFSPHLTRNGKNSDPLIISAVQRQK